MKKTGKLCALLLALIIAASIGASGCQKGSDNNTESSVSQQSSEEVTESSANTESSEVTPAEQDSDKVDFGFEAVYKIGDGEPNDENIEIIKTALENRLIYEGFENNTITVDPLERKLEIKASSTVSAEDYDRGEIDANARSVISILSSENEIIFRGGTSEDGEVILTSEHIKSAKSEYKTFDNGISDYVVNVVFTEEGKEIFAEATKKYVNQQISIWVDGECISSPTVNSVITDSVATISGDFTQKSAQDLAFTISIAGLPFKFEQISYDVIYPSDEELQNALANVSLPTKPENPVSH